MANLALALPPWRIAAGPDGGTYALVSLPIFRPKEHKVLQLVWNRQDLCVEELNLADRRFIHANVFLFTFLVSKMWF